MDHYEGMDVSERGITKMRAGGPKFACWSLSVYDQKYVATNYHQESVYDLYQPNRR